MIITILLVASLVLLLSLSLAKLEEVLKNSNTGENNNSDDGNESDNNNTSDATDSDKDNDNNSAFKDVSSSHWAYEAIEFVRKEGVMRGFEDGTFRPGDSQTRAQLATVIKKMMEK